MTAPALNVTRCAGCDTAICRPAGQRYTIRCCADTIVAPCERQSAKHWPQLPLWQDGEVLSGLKSEFEDRVDLSSQALTKDHPLAIKLTPTNVTRTHKESTEQDTTPLSQLDHATIQHHVCDGDTIVDCAGTLSNEGASLIERTCVSYTSS